MPTRLLEALDRSGLRYEMVEPTEGMKRFPDFLWYEDDIAVYEGYAGVACPWSITHGWVDYAVSRGATALPNRRLVHIEHRNGRVEGIRTEDGETYFCEQLALTTGIWTTNLVETLGSTIDIYPEIIQLNRFCSRHHNRQHPIFIDLAARTYGHSSFNGSFVGGHLPIDPEKPDHRKAIQHLSLQVASVSKQKLSLRLPWIRNSTIEGGLRAIDSYTSSKMGITAFDPRFSNLLVSAGWSCGGFTTAPVNGDRIAECLLEGRLPPNADFHVDTGRALGISAPP